MHVNPFNRWSLALRLFCLPVFALAVGCRTTGGPGRAPDGPHAGERPSPSHSLVHVSVTAQSFQFLQPWDRAPAARRRGLGVVVDGGRVLVPASLVADANFIVMERPTDGRRQAGRIVAREYECNLALIEPVDSSGGFLDGTIPLPIDSVARVGDTLEAWQIEGDGSPVVTPGRLLRVEVGSYALPGRSFLRYVFQGSVQARSGSFIMPAVRDGRLAGLFLDHKADEQTSRLLPAPIIRRFLDDVDGGGPMGFPRLGIRSVPTTDAALRRYLGLPADGGGVYVGHVAPGSVADEAGLRQGDVILTIDGFTIDRRRFYTDPDFGLLNFSHLVAGRKGAGDSLTLTVWRDRETHTLTLTLSRPAPEDMFIDPYVFDRGPRYLVLGGMVFTELTRPYLQSFREGEKNAPLLLRHAAAYPEQYSEGREKFVILSRIIPTPATVGYDALAHLPVDEVNGRRIGSLRDLHEAIGHPQEGRHAITLQGAWPVLYLDARLAEQANRQLSAFGIQPLYRLD